MSTDGDWNSRWGPGQSAERRAQSAEDRGQRAVDRGQGSRLGRDCQGSMVAIFTFHFSLFGLPRDADN